MKKIDNSFWNNIEYVKTYCLMLGMDDKTVEHYKYIIQYDLLNNNNDFNPFEENWIKNTIRKIKLNEF